MGFKSYREIEAEKRRPMAQPCTKEEMEAKYRELKITDLLGEDIEELKEWVHSHYVPSEKKNPFLRYSTIQVKNPMQTVTINIVP